MPDSSFRILIIDQNVTRASILEDGLRDAGHLDVVIIRDMSNLLKRIVDLAPDVIFIDLENPNRDVLEQMFQVSRAVQRPIAMFVDKSEAGMTEQAVLAGVSAILELCISRFKAFNQLRDELDRTRQQLEERKLVDRAKGILMKQRGMDEESAYALMRKTAMNDNLKLADVAQSIITASKLFK